LKKEGDMQTEERVRQQTEERVRQQTEERVRQQTEERVRQEPHQEWLVPDVWERAIFVGSRHRNLGYRLHADVERPPCVHRPSVVLLRIGDDGGRFEGLAVTEAQER
jgi:hypothetical protein